MIQSYKHRYKDIYICIYLYLYPCLYLYLYICIYMYMYIHTYLQMDRFRTCRCRRHRRLHRRTQIVRVLAFAPFRLPRIRYKNRVYHTEIDPFRIIPHLSLRPPPPPPPPNSNSTSACLCTLSGSAYTRHGYIRPYINRSIPHNSAPVAAAATAASTAELR